MIKNIIFYFIFFVKIQIYLKINVIRNIDIFKNT